MTSLLYLESAMQDKLGSHERYEHVNVASLIQYSVHMLFDNASETHD